MPSSFVQSQTSCPTLNGRTIIRFSQHEAATSAAMVDSVEPPQICSPRRSAMDLALSVLSHAILVRSCGGISNIQWMRTPLADRIKREGFRSMRRILRARCARRRV